MKKFKFMNLNNGIRSFGIDRISELEILNQSFKPRLKHPKEVFDKLI